MLWCNLTKLVAEKVGSWYSGNRRGQSEAQSDIYGCPFFLWCELDFGALLPRNASYFFRRSFRQSSCLSFFFAGAAVLWQSLVSCFHRLFLFVMLQELSSWRCTFSFTRTLCCSTDFTSIFLKVLEPWWLPTEHARVYPTLHKRFFCKVTLHWPC